MKKLILSLTLALSTLVSYGQGTITFVNGTLTRFTLSNEGVAAGFVPAGSALNFGVFFGTGADNLSLTPVGTLGTMSAVAGIITAPNPFALPGTEGNAVVYMQIRGWSSSFGNDWQAAQASYLAGNAGTAFGQTDVRQISPLGPTSGPGAVIWQGATGVNGARFNPLNIDVSPIPEPSTIALGILGAGSLLFLRRKK